MATPFPFTSGQTLTAAQMNAITTLPTTTKTASHTLVIADQGTRVIMNSASATTITVNTSIFGAQDVVEIQNIGAGVCTVTAGSCTVSSAGPLAIPQHGGGQLVFSSASAATFFPTAVTATASGLTLISATTIGVAATSVTVSNAFSATYDNYLITVSGGVGSNAQARLDLQLGSITTGYYYKEIFGSWANNTVSGVGTANDSLFGGVFRGSTDVLCGQVMVFAPFLTKKKSIVYHNIETRTAGFYETGGGFLDNATSVTAFTLTPAASTTVTGGTIRVYGLANS